LGVFAAPSSPLANLNCGIRDLKTTDAPDQVSLKQSYAGIV